MTEPNWPLPATYQPTEPEIFSRPGPGWYVDPSGQMRWWDGSQWTQHLAPPQQVAAYVPAPQVMAPYQMVTERHKRTSHGLHLFLTIITGGVWGIVWIIIMIVHKTTTEKNVTRVG